MFTLETHRRSMFRCLLAGLFFTGTAAAQTEQHGSSVARERSSNIRVTNTADGMEAVFDDDPLAALVNGGAVPKLVVRGVKTFPYLIRPRTHFVAEMLKSVERI